MIEKSKVIDMLRFIADSQAPGMGLGMFAQKPEAVVITCISVVKRDSAGNHLGFLLLLTEEVAQPCHLLRIFLKFVEIHLSRCGSRDFGHLCHYKMYIVDGMITDQHLHLRIFFRDNQYPPVYVQVYTPTQNID
ncbi:hypothetical protein SDC9_117420 [bioreactor metagenome]|uniref:Uncharacterized protein n=1 Tax=bioreactor metagenome TaxID=1076179 RepID=A0A645BYY7_9ZZZZ